MKIAFFSTKAYDKSYFNQYSSVHQFDYFEAPLNAQTASLANGCEAVCTFVNDVLDATVLTLLHQQGIELIVLRCAGFNNVDLETARQLNMAVARVPAYSPHAVAEHALALIITLNRKTHKAYNRVREGNFTLDKLIGFDLHQKTVGVIGTGKIGQVFCDIMLGLGCRVLAFDLVAHQPTADKGVTYLPLTDVLQHADIVSLHCPLNEQTRHIISRETIPMMKDGVMLINTSRGGLIHTKDMIAALKAGKIAYVGLDVYEQEDKLFFNDHSDNIIQDDVILRLLSFPNVLVTAHQGFLTEEALVQIANTTMGNVDDFIAGKKSENRVV
jgi:D-lactate dehydrogenase